MNERLIRMLNPLTWFDRRAEAKVEHWIAMHREIYGSNEGIYDALKTLQHGLEAPQKPKDQRTI